MLAKPTYAVLGTLLVLAGIGCNAGDFTVELDVMPGIYPNQIAADQTTLEVALLAPEHVTIYRVGQVQVTASADFEAAGPVVAATGAPVLRDVNGDGWLDLVSTFSVPKLREAGLVGPATTRLSVRASLASFGSCTGTDRLFDVGSFVLSLPAPTGSEPVGTTSVLLFDPSRTGATAAGRAIAVRFWYPAASTAAEPTTYFLDDREAEANVPQGFQPTLYDAVHAQSVRNADAATRADRPALIFSTGLGLPLSLYSGIAQDLASHGYVVAGIEHADGSGVVVYPDGTKSQADPTAQPDSAWARRWVGDIEFVVDWLGRTRHLSNLSGAVRGAVDRIDLKRIGALGHSFGGAAAVWAAAESPALKGSVNMDGSFWGDVINAGPKTPSLMMLAEGHLPLDSTLTRFVEHARGPVYTVEVAGAGHGDFSDVAVLIDGLRVVNPDIPPSSMGLGTIGGARSFAIESAYLRAFFDWALSQEPSDLLAGPSNEFPEVTLTRSSTVDALPYTGAGL